MSPASTPEERRPSFAAGDEVPALRNEQLAVMFHEIADRGAAVFVSSHVMDEADRCDRLMLMREGVIIADDTPDGIREKTRTDDIESAFLSLVEQTGDAA